VIVAVTGELEADPETVSVWPDEVILFTVNVVVAPAPRGFAELEVSTVSGVPTVAVQFNVLPPAFFKVIVNEVVLPQVPALMVGGDGVMLITAGVGVLVAVGGLGVFVGNGRLVAVAVGLLVAVGRAVSVASS
jgi:hypothetical protein